MWFELSLLLTTCSFHTLSLKKFNTSENQAVLVSFFKMELEAEETKFL